MRHIVNVKHRPTRAEMTAHVTKLADDPGFQLVAQSKWLDDSTRQWLVSKRPDGRHMATMVIAECDETEVAYRLVDETEGILETDIPKRMLKLLDGSNPQNEYSANWRHEARKAQRSGNSRVPPDAFANIRL